MRVAAIALWGAVTAGGCTPIEPIDRFNREVTAAKEKRRVVALASPT